MQSAELIIELAKKEFKLKYKNTYFGYFWCIFNPILLLIILYVVFTYVMRVNVPNFQIFLLIGVICWNYFSETTTGSMHSIISNSNLLKKQKIYPHVFVISSCLSNLTGLLLNFAVLIALMIFFKIEINLLDITAAAYLIMLFILTMGISFIVSGIYVLFKDVQHMWSFALMILFWVSPIVYSESSIHSEFRKYFMLNPIARIISHLRNVFIYNYADLPEQVFITFLICIIVLFLGYWLFTSATANVSERL